LPWLVCLHGSVGQSLSPSRGGSELRWADCCNWVIHKSFWISLTAAVRWLCIHVRKCTRRSPRSY
jgi:hypothetical protein